MLAALAARNGVEASVAVVVAHPDDETIALGGSLSLLRRLLLVHVTDGAPRRLGDAAREGFGSPAAYASARAAELDWALALGGAAPAREALGIPDQDAVDHVGAIAGQLEELFRRHDVRHVLTHAYEGGHPDHDAVAAAVAATGWDTVEFAGYHRAAGGGLEAGFLPGPPAIAVELGAAELGRKRAMLACFASQAEILSRFDPATERFRPAPRYDFDVPPHAGPLLYEEWGWMDHAEWRRRARKARCAG